ncbi:MAG: hypothetical protein PHV30_08595 [Candidatus Margulisbacteria bacterium]|nr:hypothetical protein [Candidatus Margulisiibacteriota bacterium]
MKRKVIAEKSCPEILISELTETEQYVSLTLAQNYADLEAGVILFGIKKTSGNGNKTAEPTIN